MLNLIRRILVKQGPTETKEDSLSVWGGASVATTFDDALGVEEEADDRAILAEIDAFFLGDAAEWVRRSRLN